MLIMLGVKVGSNVDILGTDVNNVDYNVGDLVIAPKHIHLIFLLSLMVIINH